MIESTQRKPNGIEFVNDQPPPGFGHRLYPNGDPRAIEVLQCCPAPMSWQRVARTLVKNNSSWHPTLDFGLATLEHQLKLPKGPASQYLPLDVPLVG